MAVTSLWRVKGYIGKVLLYAENPDKTTNPETIPVAEELNRDTLEDVISYAGREEATNQRQLVWGVNCTAENARREMMAVKKQFGKEFFESHPVICFDSVDEPGQYQVIAAFRYNTNNETFKYNKHSDMDEAEFAEYVANCKSRSLYDTGITAEYGDMLITLSTCEYTYTNGRFVVVAKKIVE